MSEGGRVVDIIQLRRYKDSGLELIPLHSWDSHDEKGVPRGKTPRDAHWRVRLYEMSELKTWVDAGGNVGVRLGPRDVVIDYDPRNEPEGRDVRAELEIEYGINLSELPQVRTGSGGAHYYLRFLEDVKVRNQIIDRACTKAGHPKATCNITHRCFPGIEFKARGRQVVAAGSKHPNSQMYVWATDVFLAPRPVVPPLLAEAIVRTDRTSTEQIAGSITVPDLQECLNQLDVLAYKSHDDWLELMIACHSAVSGDVRGREVFVQWSCADPEYGDARGVIESRWDSFRPNEQGGITIGTLYKHVIDAGGQIPRLNATEEFTAIEPGDDEHDPDADALREDIDLSNSMFERDKQGKPKPSISNAITAIEALDFLPAYDRMRDTTFFQGNLKRLEEVFGPMDRIWSNSCAVMLQYFFITQFKLEVAKTNITDAINGVAQRRRFNSLIDHLKSVKWDGVPRIDSWLTTYCGTEATPYSAGVGRLLLVAAAGRALAPGCKYDCMVVLEGPQGCGKSTLVKILGGEFTLEGLPHKSLNDKDVIASLISKWFVEVPELATMRRAEIDDMKEFLSRTSDRGRLAYMPTAEDFPRRVVFIGTTNPPYDYLRDMSGNRRFLPVRVNTIDLVGLERDRDQLHAEAMMAWLINPAQKLELPPNLWAVAATEANERMFVDPWLELLESYVSKIDVDRVSTESIVFEVLRMDRSRFSGSDYKRLTQAMHQLGWEKKRYRGGDRALVSGYVCPARGYGSMESVDES